MREEGLVVQISHSPSDTMALGEHFGREFLRPGVVVTVRGELGAGKTHFIKGIAQALGVDARDITSPTFTLVNEFEVPQAGSSRQRTPSVLFHLDCYRFEKPEELLALGVEDYLYPKNAATIIEWPERIEALIPASAIQVAIDVLSESERQITIRA